MALVMYEIHHYWWEDSILVINIGHIFINLSSYDHISYVLVDKEL